MTERVVGIVPARLDSQRLPRKQLRALGGFTVLGCLISRLRVSQSLDDIVVATTERPVDDDLESFALRNNVNIYRHRGDVNDVVGRLAAAANEFESTVVVRANADSPLLAPELIDVAVEQLLTNDVDLVTGKNLYTGLPVGMLGDVLSTAYLKYLDISLNTKLAREHVTAISRGDESGPVWMPVKLNFELPDAAFPVLTVDTLEDIDRIRVLIERLNGAKPESWTVSDILSVAK